MECARLRLRKARADTPGKAAADCRAYRLRRPGKAAADSAAYYRANLDKERARSRTYARNHAEQRRVWERANNASKVAKNARRRARKLNATPKWLTIADHQTMRQFYADCPKGMEVDHIYPLMGRTVCGLHVPDNLQYLSPEANRKKGNRFP